MKVSSPTYADYISPSSFFSHKIRREVFYGITLYFLGCLAFSFTLALRELQVFCTVFFSYAVHYFFSKAQNTFHYQDLAELTELRKKGKIASLQDSLERHGRNFFVVVSEEDFYVKFWEEGGKKEGGIQKLVSYYKTIKGTAKRYGLQEEMVGILQRKKQKEEKKQELRGNLARYMETFLPCSEGEVSKIPQFYREEIPLLVKEMGIISCKEEEVLLGHSSQDLYEQDILGPIPISEEIGASFSRDNTMESFLDIQPNGECSRLEEGKRREGRFRQFILALKGAVVEDFDDDL